MEPLSQASPRAWTLLGLSPLPLPILPFEGKKEGGGSEGERNGGERKEERETTDPNMVKILEFIERKNCEPYIRKYFKR